MWPDFVLLYSASGRYFSCRPLTIDLPYANAYANSDVRKVKHCGRTVLEVTNSSIAKKTTTHFCVSESEGVLLEKKKWQAIF